MLQEKDQSKLRINVHDSFVGEKFDIFLSNATNKAIICKLINNKFLSTVDRFNKCVKIADI